MARRRVGYADVDPEVSRDLFIRHALVEGDWDTHHEFFHAATVLAWLCHHVAVWLVLFSR